MIRGHGIVLVLVLSMGRAAGGEGFEDPDTMIARRHFKAATEAYNRLDFATALVVEAAVQNGGRAPVETAGRGGLEKLLEGVAST
jgi:hypothetical protein